MLSHLNPAELTMSTKVHTFHSNTNTTLLQNVMHLQAATFNQVFTVIHCTFTLFQLYPLKVNKINTLKHSHCKITESTDKQYMDCDGTNVMAKYNSRRAQTQMLKNRQNNKN